MKTRGPKLEWLSLFMLLPLMAILGYMEVHLRLSPTGHTLVQFAILIFIGFLVNGWISANELEMRQSQVRHKPPEPARQEESQSDLESESNPRHANSTSLFTRLTELVKPIIHRG